MDLPIENSYGVFREDERWKKLVRAVKMLQLKQLENKNTGNCAPDTGANISSINGDSLDTACAHSSKLGSEIISSSTNMKHLFAHKKNSLENNNNNNDNNNIATSSVKNSPDNDPARIIMPPPKSIPVFSNSPRKNTLKACEASTLNQQHGPAGLGSNCFRPTLSVISSIKCPSSLETDSPKKYTTCVEKVETSTTKITKPDRVFERWKVMINDEGYLIIRGILNGCKNNVTSEPIIRKINTTVIQSCFNHIYELQGSIYDDKHELPKYVREKFCTGFPDDWENVFQLWRSYISDGCKPSFRWPTPVADSDDDLISDITELEHPQQKRRFRSRSKSSDSMPIKKTLKIPSGKISTKSSKMIEKKSQSSVENVENITGESSEETNDTYVEVNLLPTRMDDQYHTNSTPHDTIDKDVSKMVNTILNYKNCSVKYVKKIIEKLNHYIDVNTSKSQQSFANVTNNSPSFVASQKVSLTELGSNNSRVTGTKVKNIQNNISRYLNPPSVQNVNISQPSTSGSNVPCIGRVGRKPYKKDYESSELSESNTEIQRRKSPRIAVKMYEIQRSAGAMTNKEKRLRKIPDGSGDELVPKKVEYPDKQNVYANKRVNNVQTRVNKANFKDSTKPMSGVKPESIPNNSMKLNSIELDEIDNKTLLSSKLKLNQEKSNSNYDSGVSITEDGLKYFGNKINESKMRKQDIQQPIEQCFRQMLKRNLKHQTGNTKLVDKKHLQDHPVIKERSLSLQSKISRGFSKHNSADLNEDKENTPDQMKNVNQSNKNLSRNRQTSANKLHLSQEKMKPSIICVEEVSNEVNDSLLKTHREESLKNESSKSNTNKRSSKENNRLSSHSNPNDTTNTANFKSLELDLKMACKDVRVQLVDIKNTLKLKSRAMKNVNDDRSSGKFIFGSQENPKQLKSWFPNVIRKDDLTYGLIFEGKLLNEAGHVKNKYLRTDFVVKRLSLKVIKTNENEFYELIGDLSDTKHVVPKELYKRCMNGCPGQIPNFCKKWMSIIDKFDPLNESMNSIDMTSVSQSSRGRRILPTLSYWSGERLSVKGDHSIYTPPKSFCTSFEISKKDRSLSVKKNLNNSTGQDKSKNLSQENENIVNVQIRENNKELEESTEPKKKKEERQLRKSNRKRKELIKASKLFEDSYSSYEEGPILKRRQNGYNDKEKKENCGRV